MDGAGEKQLPCSALPPCVHGQACACWKSRSKLAGFLSRRNTASHRCCGFGRRTLLLHPCPGPFGLPSRTPFRKRMKSIPPGGQNVQARTFFLPELSHWLEKQKAPCRSLLTKIQAFAVKTPYGGIVHIRWRVEACASSQPNGSPVFRSDYSAILRLCQWRSIAFDKNTPGFHRNFTFICQNRVVWLGHVCKFSPQMLNVV